MKINHTVAHYVIGAAALGLAGFATVHQKAPQLIPAAVHEQVRASTFDWPGLGQMKTIALADKLQLIPKSKVTLFCAVTTCHELMADLDDAFQIAGWSREFEGQQVDSEHNTGIFVGPPGSSADAVASAIQNITSGKKPGIVGIPDIEGVGIIIGKVGN